MPARLYAHGDQPGRTSERTHDDCQWLNEEDGEEDVPGNGSDGNRCDGPPGISGNQRRNGYWKDDARTEYCARDDRDERRRRLTRLLALGHRAARIGLCLRDNPLFAGVVGLALVHRARVIRAACHPTFWGCRPPGAHGHVAGKQYQTQGNGRKALEQSHSR
jgi:hypothetical protein